MSAYSMKRGDMTRDETETISSKRYEIPVFEIDCHVNSNLAVEGTEQIETPKIAARIFSDFFGKNPDREKFAVMCIDNRGRVIGVNLVAIGDIGSVFSEPRETFKLAILQQASAVIVAHCHPNSDVEPSPGDESATKRLMLAGSLMGISVLDHLIIGHGGKYTSIMSYMNGGGEIRYIKSNSEMEKERKMQRLRDFFERGI